MITRSLKALVIMCLVTLGTETHCAFTPQDKLALAIIGGGGAFAAAIIADNVANDVIETLEDINTFQNSDAIVSFSISRLCDDMLKPAIIIALPTLMLTVLTYLNDKKTIGCTPLITALLLGYTTTLGILVGKKLDDEYEAKFRLYQR